MRRDREIADCARAHFHTRRECWLRPVLGSNAHAGTETTWVHRFRQNRKMARRRQLDLDDDDYDNFGEFYSLSIIAPIPSHQPVAHRRSLATAAPQMVKYLMKWPQTRRIRPSSTEVSGTSHFVVPRVRSNPHSCTPLHHPLHLMLFSGV